MFKTIEDLVKVVEALGFHVTEKVDGKAKSEVKGQKEAGKGISQNLTLVILKGNCTLRCNIFKTVEKEGSYVQAEVCGKKVETARDIQVWVEKTEKAFQAFKA